ncbi:ORC-CDC6 family AAA ATPase [Alicyclobacillus fastidiosus]|uniref:AAA+ ATPase domain-containing protein n=1 Tax=Alicyclobacillus fastidiosus TaxID=392011 RepID=A0ABV5AEI8_9BACL
MPAIHIEESFFQHDAQAYFDPSTHIDPGFSIDKYVRAQGINTLVEGIRGTGKTHILKMISTRFIERFDELRVLPVYVSMAEVSEFVSKEADLFRVHLYSTLILRTIENIKNNRGIWESRKAGVKQLFIGIAKMFGFMENSDFDTLITELERHAEELQREILYNPTKISELAKSSDGLNLTAGHGGVSVGVQGNTENSISVEYLTVKLSHLNASQFLSQFYKYMNQIFGLRHTVLLIDECSDLPNDAQTEVFRFFKFIRGGTRIDNSRNYLYFIGGVYPPQATNYPSKSLGGEFDFEPGDDCSVEYLELDIQLDNYEEFFRKLTTQKMTAFDARLSTGVLDIFEEERAFVLAAYAAHGLPRRYFEILHHAYENLVDYVNSISGVDSKVYKMRFTDVASSIEKIVTSNILNTRRLPKEDFATLEAIIAALTRRNRKVETESATKEKHVPINFYFNCPRSKEEIIGNLISKGVLHNQARTRTLKHTVEGMSGKGLVIMVDLAVSYSQGIIPNKTKVIEVLQRDTKLSAKNGYEYCQTISF